MVLDKEYSTIFGWGIQNCLNTGLEDFDTKTLPFQLEFIM